MESPPKVGRGSHASPTPSAVAPALTSRTSAWLALEIDGQLSHSSTMPSPSSSCVLGVPQQVGPPSRASTGPGPPSASGGGGAGASASTRGPASTTSRTVVSGPASGGGGGTMSAPLSIPASIVESGVTTSVVMSTPTGTSEPASTGGAS